MRKPVQPAGEPRFTSDAQLARFVGLTDSHMSHFLRRETRGVSWKVVDRFAKAFDLEIWQLFYRHAPYTWQSKGPEPGP